MTVNREKFATQVDKVLLADLRRLAKSEGRQIQALIEEAIQKLLDDKLGYKMRPEVKLAYEKSLTRFTPLYEKLAK